MADLWRLRRLDMMQHERDHAIRDLRRVTAELAELRRSMDSIIMDNRNHAFSDVKAITAERDAMRGELQALSLTNGQLIADRAAARHELAELRRSLREEAHAEGADERKASAFWFTMWKEANRRIAVLELKLAELRKASRQSVAP